MDLVFLIIATGVLTGKSICIHHSALFFFLRCTSPPVVVNLIALALFATLSYIPAFISTAIMIFMPKLYANSILVMFNNRITIGDSRNASSNTESNAVVSTFAAADGGN